jgi:hypothetical protein
LCLVVSADSAGQPGLASVASVAFSSSCLPVATDSLLLPRRSSHKSHPLRVLASACPTGPPAHRPTSRDDEKSRKGQRCQSSRGLSRSPPSPATAPARGTLPGGRASRAPSSSFPWRADAPEEGRPPTGPARGERSRVHDAATADERPRRPSVAGRGLSPAARAEAPRPKETARQPGSPEPNVGVPSFLFRGTLAS